MKEENKKTVLITGASSGIGKAILKLFSKNNYRVLGVARNEEKANELINEIKSKNNNSDIKFFIADLSNLEEVRKLSFDVIKFLNNEPLDILINNAGGVKDKYTKTADGYEYQFALNHLSGFLLSFLLKESLKNGIIMFTGSRSHYKAKIYWKDVMLERNYFIIKAYKQSKLANLITSMHLNEEFKHLNIRAYTVDPGLVKTDIGAKGTSFLSKFVWKIHAKKGDDPSVPAKTYLYLALNRPKEGIYFLNSKAVSYNPIAIKEFQSKKLFKLSEKLCKINYQETTK